MSDIDVQSAVFWSQFQTARRQRQSIIGDTIFGNWPSVGDVIQDAGGSWMTDTRGTIASHQTWLKSKCVKFLRSYDLVGGTPVARAPDYWSGVESIEDFDLWTWSDIETVLLGGHDFARETESGSTAYGTIEVGDKWNARLWEQLATVYGALKWTLQVPGVDIDDYTRGGAADGETMSDAISYATDQFDDGETGAPWSGRVATLTYRDGGPMTCTLSAIKISMKAGIPAAALVGCDTSCYLKVAALEGANGGSGTFDDQGTDGLMDGLYGMVGEGADNATVTAGSTASPPSLPSYPSSDGAVNTRGWVVDDVYNGVAIICKWKFSTITV